MKGVDIGTILTMITIFIWVVPFPVTLTWFLYDRFRK